MKKRQKTSKLAPRNEFESWKYTNEKYEKKITRLARIAEHNDKVEQARRNDIFSSIDGDYWGSDADKLKKQESSRVHSSIFCKPRPFSRQPIFYIVYDYFDSFSEMNEGPLFSMYILFNRDTFVFLFVTKDSVVVISFYEIIQMIFGNFVFF